MAFGWRLGFRPAPVCRVPGEGEHSEPGRDGGTRPGRSREKDGAPAECAATTSQGLDASEGGVGRWRFASRVEPAPPGSEATNSARSFAPSSRRILSMRVRASPTLTPRRTAISASCRPSRSHCRTCQSVSPRLMPLVWRRPGEEVERRPSLPSLRMRRKRSGGCRRGCSGRFRLRKAGRRASRR